MLHRVRRRHWRSNTAGRLSIEFTETLNRTESNATKNGDCRVRTYRVEAIERIALWPAMNFFQ